MQLNSTSGLCPHRLLRLEYIILDISLIIFVFPLRSNTYISHLGEFQLLLSFLPSSPIGRQAGLTVVSGILFSFRCPPKGPII